jgi:hypothetical protein
MVYSIISLHLYVIARGGTTEAIPFVIEIASLRSQ